MLVLGSVIVIGFFSLLALLIISVTPLVNKDLLNITVGALIASFTTVVGYFFGSSSGSKTKTDLLSKAEPIKEDTLIIDEEQ